MSNSNSNSDWLALLRERAHQPPQRPRESLWLAEPQACIGSIEPVLAQRLSDAGLPLQPSADGWAVQGPPDEALARIAQWLHGAGLCNGWRGELLSVTDDKGRSHAVIERASVRPLGIATHAVHLLGLADDNGIWVQQRAWAKPTDPGLWDTTVGGLQAAGESAADALRRETWEEAGLVWAELASVTSFGRLTVRRPLPHGYMVEHIQWVARPVPPALVPVNRDGEVERFERWSRAQLLQRLQSGAFTLEAALALAAWLQRNGDL